MTQRKGQGLPQGLPQQMGHLEGQGMPQRLGIPYSLLPTPYSLLPFRISSPSIRSTEGTATREATPEQSVTPSDAWMEEIDLWVDLEAEVPCEVVPDEHPADLLAVLDCMTCGAVPKFICWGYWRELFDGKLIGCSKCGQIQGRPEEFCRIVEVLR